MFDTLNFIQPVATAEIFFDNGFGVSVRQCDGDRDLYWVDVLHLEFGFGVSNYAINNALSLGIHQSWPMNRTEVGEIMSQIEAR